MTRLRVCSYNVRYANSNEHHDVWPARRSGVTSLLRFHDPDVVGLQEPLPDQRTDIESDLSAYTFVGEQRSPADEACPIGVDTNRWKVTETETFWLSETPETESVGWDASYPRIATWARIEPDDRSAGTSPEAWYAFNTHFDHASEHARWKAARLLRKRIDDVAGDQPVVLTGDLNCTSGSEPHRILTDGDLRDAADAATVRHGPETSLTDYHNLLHGRRIDHVLVSSAIDVDGFATLADRDDRGRYPSDHLPVLARMRL